MNGNSPLHTAVIEGNVEEVIRLINDGANIYAKNDYGRYPGFYAIQGGMEPMFKYVVDANILSEMDDYGRYPIYYLSKTRASVYTFIQMGGDILSKDKYNKNGVWHIYNSMTINDYSLFNSHPRLLEHTFIDELMDIDPDVRRYIERRTHIELWAT